MWLYYIFPVLGRQKLTGLCMKHSFSCSKDMSFHSNSMMGLCGKADRFIWQTTKTLCRVHVMREWRRSLVLMYYAVMPLQTLWHIRLSVWDKGNSICRLFPVRACPPCNWPLCIPWILSVGPSLDWKTLKTLVSLSFFSY